MVYCCDDKIFMCLHYHMNVKHCSLYNLLQYIIGEPAVQVVDESFSTELIQFSYHVKFSVAYA